LSFSDTYSIELTQTREPDKESFITHLDLYQTPWGKRNEEWVVGIMSDTRTVAIAAADRHALARIADTIDRILGRN